MAASTLGAASIAGLYEGYYSGFGGSLTPATLNGATCTILVTGLSAGKISGSFSGDVVSDFTGEDINVDGTDYSISGTPTYDSGSNTTGVEWDYGPGNFVAGTNYDVEVGGSAAGQTLSAGLLSNSSSFFSPTVTAASGSSPDFKILRGSSIIASGQTTLALTNTTDYTLESGIASDAWFFQIANSNLSGMGRTATGSSQNADDFMVSVSTSGNNVTLTRRGTANDCRVDWQIIQYIGSSGGDNEIKVRGVGTSTAAASNATTSVAIPGSVVSNSNLVPFITGQDNGETGRNNIHAGLFTADINGSNVDFQRGRTTDAATVSYAFVEFTGSNWTTTNEQFVNPSASGTDSTVSLGTAVTDIAETFLHCQYRYDLAGTAGLDDASVRVRLTSTAQFSVRDTTATGDSSKNHSIWVIQNPDISVARYIGTMAGSGEEEVADIAITTVADTTQVLTTLTNDSTGAGTAFPRGFVNHLLTDDSTVRLRQSDNGQTSQYALEVVILPESSGGSSGQALTPSLFTNTNSFYASTVSAGAISLSPGLISSTNSFFGPTIGQQAPTQDLTVPLVTNASTFYAPVGGIGSVSITPSLVANDNTFFSPSVSAGAVDLTPSSLPSSNSFFGSNIGIGGVTLTVPITTNASQFYAPSITAGSVGLQPALLANATTFYSPGVSTAAQALTPSLFTNQSSFYSPVVSLGATTISASLFTNTNEFYSPVAMASYSISPPVLSSGNVIYLPSLSGGVTLTPSLLANASVFYGPTVALEATTLSPSLYSNTNVFFAPAVTPGTTTLTPQLFNQMADRKVRYAGWS